MYILLILTYLIGFVTANMEDAGIIKTGDNMYFKQFHSGPDAYLGWEVRGDGTIWFDLNCMELGAARYCGFGLGRPGRPAAVTTSWHHAADIYTAHGHTVDDRFSDLTSARPRLDIRSDIVCDHCGLQDGSIHATFYRTLSTGDDQDVTITDRTYRVSWAIGMLKGDDIGYHNFTPQSEREYMYINFINPNATVMPLYSELSTSDAARTIETLLVAALFGAVLVLVLR